jgi:hypothetical protein
VASAATQGKGNLATFFARKKAVVDALAAELKEFETDHKNPMVQADRLHEEMAAEADVQSMGFPDMKKTVQKAVGRARDLVEQLNALKHTDAWDKEITDAWKQVSKFKEEKSVFWDIVEGLKQAKVTFASRSKRKKEQQRYRQGKMFKNLRKGGCPQHLATSWSKYCNDLCISDGKQEIAEAPQQ